MSCDCDQPSSCDCGSKNFTVSEPTAIPEAGEECPCDNEFSSKLVEEGGDASSVSNATQTDEMDLVGVEDGRFAKFATTLNGFIQIIAGKAKVVTGLPAIITSWWHTDDADPATPAKEAPSHVIADATGNLHLIRGGLDDSAIEVWDKTKQAWVVTPLADFPHCHRGIPKKASHVEILGLSAEDHKTEPILGTDERKEVVLKGDGVVIVKNFSNGDPTNPLSVATVVPTPDDRSNSVWFLAYNFSDGYYMTPLDGITGGGGNDGDDGFTPEVGFNGNWFIDGVDTGFPSRGIQGPSGFTPTIDVGGNWFIDGVDTGLPSQGAAGVGTPGAPGDTPTIDVGGNWFIGGVDTGVKADASAVGFTTTPINVENADTFAGLVVAGQLLNEAAEVPLNINSNRKDTGWTHTNGSPIINLGGGYDRVQINATVKYTGIAAGISPQLRLYKGIALVAESATAYQVGTDHTQSSNQITYTDYEPGVSGDVYGLTAIAGTPVVGNTAYAFTSITLVAFKKGVALATITLT